LTKLNSKAGFRRTGLCPLNPHLVTSKLPANTYIENNIKKERNIFKINSSLINDGFLENWEEYERTKKENKDEENEDNEELKSISPINTFKRKPERIFREKKIKFGNFGKQFIFKKTNNELNINEKENKERKKPLKDLIAQFEKKNQKLDHENQRKLKEEQISMKNKEKQIKKNAQKKLKK
jgi:hypothetical protein